MNNPSCDRRQNWRSESARVRGLGMPCKVCIRVGEKAKKIVERFHWPNWSKTSDMVYISSCLVSGPMSKLRKVPMPIQLSYQNLMERPSRINQPFPFSQIYVEEHKLFQAEDFQQFEALSRGYLEVRRWAQRLGDPNRRSQFCLASNARFLHLLHFIPIPPSSLGRVTTFQFSRWSFS